ncbi:MAG: questin oxidase family protein [Pseudomonadales bacterium]
MPATTTVAEPLRAALTAHHARYSPVYRGYLSDHGPMGALALHGLGARPARVLDWLNGYRQRLEPLSAAPARYRQLLEARLDDVHRLGVDALLSAALPRCISGWPRNAYHPLIRTAYGYRFDLPDEVAAGLAYLEWCGEDPILADLAGRARPATNPQAAFDAMRACATTVEPHRRFDACLDWVVRQPAFREAAVLVPEPLTAYSRRALGVFAATGDFFALHLVTGAHAFRLLYDFAGPARDAVFALGLLAGYASVGAPAFEPLPDAAEQSRMPADTMQAVTGDAGAAGIGDDEHDIKIAYSAASQAEWFADPTYLRVCRDYLAAS